MARTVKPTVLSTHVRLALDRIIKENDGHLRGFLRQRLSDEAEREDVAQEIFLKLARYDAIAEVRNPKSFLFRMAENIIRDRARARLSRKTDKHQTIEEQILADPQPSQERALMHKQKLGILQQAILELDLPVRRAFLLSRYEGLKYREIADRMGLSIKTIEGYISVALEHFRQAVQRQETGEMAVHTSLKEEDEQ